MANSHNFLPLPTPEEDLEYPLSITYCGICSMPVEYCEYSTTKNDCLTWQREHLDDEMVKLSVDDENEDGKKRQSRGGKGTGGKKVTVKEINVFRSTRGNAYTTSIIGCKSCAEIDIKQLTSLFGKKFCCGSSYVRSSDEILLQGDFKEQIISHLLQTYSSLDKESIMDRGDKKRPN